MMDCLQECWLNNQKKVCLFLNDVFIAPGSTLAGHRLLGRQWCDLLKSHVISNVLSSLSIMDEKRPEILEDIVKSLGEVNFIQKLWLAWVSGPIVIDLLSRPGQSLSENSDDT